MQFATAPVVSGGGSCARGPRLQQLQLHFWAVCGDASEVSEPCENLERRGRGGARPKEVGQCSPIPGELRPTFPAVTVHTPSLGGQEVGHASPQTGEVGQLGALIGQEVGHTSPQIEEGWTTWGADWPASWPHLSPNWRELAKFGVRLAWCGQLPGQSAPQACRNICVYIYVCVCVCV
jgi:hypothetical protein